MKKILLIVLSAGVVFSLLKMNSDPAKKAVVIDQVSEAVEEPRFDRPDMIAQIRKEITTPDDRETPEYEEGYLHREITLAKKHAQSLGAKARTSADDLTFVERGPANVPGRTRGVIIYPGDATGNTWLAGSAGGGIWKTTDAGASWVNKTPDFPNLGTTTLAMSESDMNVMYAGTGEGFFSSTGMISGMGMFKSLDAGDTWTLLESTAGVGDFGSINRIIVDPSTPDILLACMNNTIHDPTVESSIRKSVDGGATWTIVYESNARIQQIVHDPTDFNIQYATHNGRGVLKSTDGGDTWNDSSTGLAPGGRVEIAISPVNTDRLFASAQGGLSGVGSDLYTSTDAGATWTSVNTASTAIDFLGGQGWYDNGVLAHPFIENSVYVCAVNTFNFTIGTETVEGNEQVSSVEENGTDAFFDVVNFSAPFFRGGLDISDNAASRTYVSVEIRFGSGRSQMAHRFHVPEGEGAGVDDANYTYQDYVEVPFEVWDIDNNRQLMVSFRDQQRDGDFDLFESNTDGDASTHAREYIYISEEDYDASGPSSTIAVDGGHVASDLYFLWPVLRPGADSDPSTWPTSELVINWSSVTQLVGETTVMTDAYNEFDGKNLQGVKHPDHHDIYAIIDDADNQEFRILNSTDGGVFITNSGTNPGFEEGDWIFTGHGYNTSQFYGADKAPGSDRYIGGMQDNGTWYTAEGPADETSEYTFVIGGDGYEAIWHSSDPLKLIGASQFNGHRRSLDGGLTWNFARPGDNGSGNAPFVSRVANSKENPDVLFAVGVTGVWRSPDFGGIWESIEITEGWNMNTAGTQPEVSAANYNIVWAGGNVGEIGRLHVSTDNGLTFNATENYTDVVLGTITGLATHPTEENTAYALFSFAKRPKILKTTDLGQTWNDISGFGTNEVSSTGFPDVVVTSLLVMPHDTDRIWAGTEIGIVESLDGGATWALLESNLPSVSVWQMLVQDDQIVIATHGRGIWSVTMDGLPETISAPSLREVAESPTQDLKIRANFVNDFDVVEVYADGSLIGQQDNVTAGENILTVSGITTFGEKEIQLKAIVGTEERMSNPMTFNFIEIADPIDSYENNFRTLDEDFMANGLGLDRTFGVAGFDGGGIHTGHPYASGLNDSYIMIQPITVASSDATLNFDEIAIIETGEEGSVFGDAEFFDYVIVEGTVDGITWLPLGPGYDASANAGWLAIYNQGLTPTQTDMVARSIDLLETFDAGDVIFLRFRVFTDGGTQSWGWAVDNLSIQAGNATTGFEDDILNEKLAVRTYPNPATSQAKIEFFLPNAGNVNIEMVDMNGRTVFENNLGFRNRGLNSVDWNRVGMDQGIYILKLNTSNGTTTTRVQLN